MSESDILSEPTGRSSGRRWVPVFAGGLIAVVLAMTAVALENLRPPLPGREGRDALTIQIAALLDLTARLSMVTTFGLLLGAAYFSRGRHHHHELSDEGRRLTRLAGHSSALWFAACVLEVVFVAAENNGVSWSYAMGALGAFISATQAAGSWIIPAIIAFLTMALARRIRTMGGALIPVIFGLVWQLGPIATGNASVGHFHDFGSDASFIAAIAGALTLAAGLGALFGTTDARGRARRYTLIAGIALPFLVIAEVIIAWYEMAGTPLTSSLYGLVRLTALVGWSALLVSVLVRLFRRHTGGLGLDVALGLIALGAEAATAHIAPPRFLVRQESIQINYLGYELPDPPTLARLFAPGRPNLLLATIIVLVMVAYVAAFILLRRRGVAWPWLRLVSWLIGWGILLWLATAGIWAYSSAMFSKHMLVHMTLNMLGPVLIVLGAPMTLALRVLPAQADGAPGVRELLAAVMAWKPLEVILHPIVVGINFVASFYIIYFSSLFGYLMRYHWGHQLMTIHFLVSGLLFFGLVAGPDRMPRELPHIAKLAFLFAAMPFHAFFAVAVMQGESLIGGDYYKALAMPWMTDLIADQNEGGQYTWALGEVPMVVVVIALVVQWFLHDDREAKRRDRADDSGLDDSYEAYNEMLKKLAERGE